jgi:hypothetical protein
MGTWGPGVFENDHALDLFSLEVARLVKEVETVLAIERLAFDDLEGPLLYVHLLALLAREHEVTGLDRTTVERWKRTYVEAFDSTIGADTDYVAKRRKVITRAFDTLARRLPAPAVAPRPAKKTARGRRTSRR